jgi:hypothetical protein
VVSGLASKRTALHTDFVLLHLDVFLSSISNVFNCAERNKNININNVISYFTVQCV